MVRRIGLPPTSLPVSELSEVAALRSGLPLLVGLVRVLVGEVGGLCSVALVVGLCSVALVVVVMVVAICIVNMPAAAVIVGY